MHMCIMNMTLDIRSSINLFIFILIRFHIGHGHRALHIHIHFQIQILSQSPSSHHYLWSPLLQFPSLSPMFHMQHESITAHCTLDRDYLSTVHCGCACIPSGRAFRRECLAHTSKKMKNEHFGLNLFRPKAKKSILK